MVTKIAGISKYIDILTSFDFDPFLFLRYTIPDFRQCAAIQILGDVILRYN